MGAKKGYYGLIQYCPDISRAEAANVGVILYCPDLSFIEARTSVGNDRVRRFFGPDRDLDLARLKAAKRAIETRLASAKADFQGVEDLSQFIASRANELRVTALRSLRVQDPAAELDSLFEELVGGRSAREPKGPMLPVLDRQLRRASLAGRVQFDPPPVEIPLVGRHLKVAYAYRNGSLNLVKPERFTTASSSLRTAERLAVEGDLLQSQPVDGAERKLIVVSEFDRSLGEKVVASVRGVLNHYNTRIILPDQISAFVEQVDQEAHPMTSEGGQG